MMFEPRSGKSEPGTPARSVLLQMPGSGERFEMTLDRVPICAGRAQSFGYGHVPALAAPFDDFHR